MTHDPSSLTSLVNLNQEGELEPGLRDKIENSPFTGSGEEFVDNGYETSFTKSLWIQPNIGKRSTRREPQRLFSMMPHHLLTAFL